MTGKKIRLRALEPTDIDLLYEWENDQETWKISNTITPFSRFILEQYILNSHQDIYTTKQLRLMIETIDTNNPIGTADLFDFDPLHRRIGIGIMITADFRSKGYASETLHLLLSYCFMTLNVHQVYCNIASANQISLKFFASKGFRKAGIKHDWLLFDNKWEDEVMLQLINPND